MTVLAILSVALVLFPIIFLILFWGSFPALIGKKKRVNDVEYHVSQSSTKTSAMVETCIRGDKGFDFLLSRQIERTRNEEFQTGDREFDQFFYIASDDPHFHQVLKNNSELREIALEFNSVGPEFAQLGSRFGRMWVTYRTKFHISKENVAQIGQRSAELLIKLNEKLAPHPAPSAALKHVPFIRRMYTFQAVCHSLALATIIIFLAARGRRNDHYSNIYNIRKYLEMNDKLFTVDNGEFILWTLLFTIIGATIIFGLMYLLFRNSSRWREMVLFLVGFTGYCMFTVAPIAVNSYNRHNDLNYDVYDTIISHKSRRSRVGKYSSVSNKLYVHVPDWEEDGDVSWKVTISTYERVAVEDSITLHVHSGRLGIRWAEWDQGNDR